MGTITHIRKFPFWTVQPVDKYKDHWDVGKKKTSKMLFVWFKCSERYIPSRGWVRESRTH